MARRRSRKKERLELVTRILWGAAAFLLAAVLVLGIRNLFGKLAGPKRVAATEAAAGRPAGPGGDAVPIGPSRTAAPETEEEAPAETEEPETSAAAADRYAGVSYTYPMPGTVLTDINLRKNPEPGAPIIRVAAEGEKLEVLSRTESGYYEVKTDEGSGYVLPKYLIPDQYIAADSPFAGAEATLSGIDPEKPMVALTFDDGPGGETTARILSALEKAGGKATFFMMGFNVTGENNELVLRMIEDGCELGNHTYNHENLEKLDAAGVRTVVRRCDYMVEETCGQAPSVMRPPYGDENEKTMSSLKALGHGAILWSIDTLDWEHKNPDRTYNEIMTKVQDGDIILMHDVYPTTADAAERVIPALKERGFQLVTVSQLAAARGTRIEPGVVYKEFWK